MTTSMKSMAGKLRELQSTIAAAKSNRDSFKYFAAWRAVLRLYENVSQGRSNPEPRAGEKQYQQLWQLAGKALIALAGQEAPTLKTLDQYDHLSYGPMLGVSDEGSAAAAVRQGALASPKSSVLTVRTPLTIGVAHDAERLGAIGEVVVGPQEYSKIRLGCMGRILTTTNVGTQVNLRNFEDMHVIKITSSNVRQAVVTATDRLKVLFMPFWKTPSGRPRALTILVQFDHRIGPKRQETVLEQLQAAVAVGDFCSPNKHRLGLLVNLASKTRVRQTKAAIDLACKRGVGKVAVGGATIAVAGEVKSLPGLLNHFPPEELAELLADGAKHGVALETRQRVDPQTTARHVWQGLMVARNMGLELGKYGLAPLTFEQQREVIARIQTWISDWCAAPVCYIDYPIITTRRVYYGKTLAAGIQRWLEMVRTLRVRVVLIDTAKKSEGRRLLKDDLNDDRGILTMKEIGALDSFAQKLGIKTLWAGGISMAQAFTFGKLRVFGLYVTSAAASPQPLRGRARLDPALAAEREPNPAMVACVKLLIEAGFLVSRLRADGLTGQSNELAAAADELISVLGKEGDGKERQGRQRELYSLAVSAWTKYIGRHTNNRKLPPTGVQTNSSPRRERKRGRIR